MILLRMPYQTFQHIHARPSPISHKTIHVKMTLDTIAAKLGEDIEADDPEPADGSPDVSGEAPVGRFDPVPEPVPEPDPEPDPEFEPVPAPVLGTVVVPLLTGDVTGAPGHNPLMAGISSGRLIAIVRVPQLTY